MGRLGGGEGAPLTLSLVRRGQPESADPIAASERGHSDLQFAGQDSRSMSPATRISRTPEALIPLKTSRSCDLLPSRMRATRGAFHWCMGDV